MKVRRAGLSGWLIELEPGRSVHGLTRHLMKMRENGLLPGAFDVVPGARTVLVDGEGAALDHSTIIRATTNWDDESEPSAVGEPPRRVEIPVVYGGPDLDVVAGLTGLSTDEVVAAHTGTDATVAFCGFAAGFAYITGLPEVLNVPRKDQPRKAVEPGSVGLAAGFTGIYPRRSPGGWQLIGRTDIELWNEKSDPPALLSPGTVVRFRSV